MKLLLDECVVRDLKRDLAATRSTQRSWKPDLEGWKTDNCYAQPPVEYDVLVTVDRNLPFQQNIGFAANRGVTSHTRFRQLRTRILNRLSHSFSKRLSDHPARRDLSSQLVINVEFVCSFKAVLRRACRGG